MNFSGKSSISQVILFLLLIAALVGLGMLYKKDQTAQKQIKLLSNPQEAAKAQTDQTLAKVGKLIELPKDETPTIATVTDKDKLAAQPFFAKAENNDTILIYPQAKKAILYRSSSNKVIEVGAVNIQQTQEATKTPVKK